MSGRGPRWRTSRCCTAPMSCAGCTRTCVSCPWDAAGPVARTGSDGHRLGERGRGVRARRPSDGSRLGSGGPGRVRGERSPVLLLQWGSATPGGGRVLHGRSWEQLPAAGRPPLQHGSDRRRPCCRQFEARDGRRQTPPERRADQAGRDRRRAGPSARGRPGAGRGDAARDRGVPAQGGLTSPASGSITLRPFDPTPRRTP